ncbi:MAG: HAD-IA family hydrolase [bacterium]
MISFVYFDVGGVVIDDINGTDKWVRMKRDIGITEENDKEFSQFYDNQEEGVCNGKDIDTIIPLIEERFHVSFPVGYSLLADFINRFGKNRYIQLVIDKIKQKCRIGLLTNMYPRMLSAMAEKGIMPEIAWDVIIDSSVEGCQKPESKIFQLAEEKANVKKNEILFIDNKIENINAAKDFGWQTFFYDSSDHKKSCSDLLDYYNKVK